MRPRVWCVFVCLLPVGAVCRVWCKVDHLPSQALLAAQEKLLALRQQVQRQPHFLPSRDTATRHYGDTVTAWPTHLGWHSEPFSKLAVISEQWTVNSGQLTVNSLSISQSLSLQSPVSNLSISQSLSLQSPVSSLSVSQSLSLSISPSPNLSLSPDLALALLNHNRVAEGRVWFLLRHLDAAGRGWVAVEQVRQWLNQPESCWCVCGWRQLRILLAQGEGLFWQRQGERLWLRSVAKVAAALGLTHLSGHPVALPAHILTRPIGEVKAHFYASFHSGRNHDHQPIARTTLSRLSGLSQQTQRQYEKRAGVRPQTNFALGELATAENREERTWQQGTGVFLFTDHHGQHGPAQATYLAWQLPNDYTGPHHRQSKRRHKRLNRQLADLRLQGTAGNGPFRRTFFSDGCAAVKGQKGEEVYWRGRGRAKGGQIWYPLAKPGVY